MKCILQRQLQYAHCAVAGPLGSYWTRENGLGLLKQQYCFQVFAPLARMLGLYSFKQELEELSFRYLQPEVYKNMIKRLAILKKEQQPVVSQVCGIGSPLLLWHLLHFCCVQYVCHAACLPRDLSFSLLLERWHLGWV